MAAGHAVAILVTPAASILDVAIPTEVLTGWYDVRLCTGSPGNVALSSEAGCCGRGRSR